jgi:hypothetical protein
MAITEAPFDNEKELQAWISENAGHFLGECILLGGFVISVHHALRPRTYYYFDQSIRHNLASTAGNRFAEARGYRSHLLAATCRYFPSALSCSFRDIFCSIF